jgi:hypothetical protein
LKSFKELGIKPMENGLIGDKIDISKVLNTKIEVHKYRIVDSKFKGKCLHLQILYKDAKRVIFSGSIILMDLLERTPKEEFPFTATIVKENDRFEFN